MNGSPMPCRSDDGASTVALRAGFAPFIKAMRRALNPSAARISRDGKSSACVKRQASFADTCEQYADALDSLTNAVFSIRPTCCPAR